MLQGGPNQNLPIHSWPHLCQAKCVFLRGFQTNRFWVTPTDRDNIFKFCFISKSVLSIHFPALARKIGNQTTTIVVCIIVALHFVVARKWNELKCSFYSHGNKFYQWHCFDQPIGNVDYLPVLEACYQTLEHDCMLALDLCQPMYSFWWHWCKKRTA